MYLIVGLGNPEPEYSNTRHNMGFNTVNLLAKEYKIEFNKSKFKGIYGIGEIENQKVILLKPQTYMNLSGESIIEIMNFYKIDIENLIVIYDDFDTEKEKIRIRKSGSAGSHNGMKSIIGILKNEKFTRIRVGIGHPEFEHDKINYVIGRLSEEESNSLKKGVEKAKNAIIEILKNNVDIAMNKYN